MSLPIRNAPWTAIPALAVAACLVVTVAVTTIGLTTVASAQARFIDGIDDLPLMPGLESVPAASVAFDALVGRIVVAFAEGAVAMDDVRAFYDATLPQLGWDRLAADHWARAGEELTIDVVIERGGLVVRFELVPR